MRFTSAPIQKNRSGSAIIIVLMISTIAFMLTVFTISTTRKIMNSSNILMDKLHARFKAESVMQKLKFYASTGKCEANSVRNASVEGFPSRIFIDGRRQKIDNSTVVSIRDASSMLDVWYPDVNVLSNLLRLNNVTQNRIAEITSSYLDWIDNDDLVHLNGAEAQYYIGKGFKYTSRNSNDLQSIYELKLIRGMDNKTFSLIRNYLIVSPRWHINLNTEDENMLAATLGISKSFAGSLVALRNQNNGLSLDDVRLRLGKGLDSEIYETFPTPVLDIHVTVCFNRAVEKRGCVMSFYVRKENPFRVLQWEN